MHSTVNHNWPKANVARGSSPYSYPIIVRTEPLANHHPAISKVAKLTATNDPLTAHDERPGLVIILTHVLVET